MSRPLRVALLAAVLSVSALAGAAGWAPPKTDALAVELAALPREKRTALDVPGSSIKMARSEILIAAPLAKVREALLDFEKYKTLIPRFERSKVLKKDAAGTEVYLQIPVLKGAAKIWVQYKFAPVKTDGAWTVIDGKFVTGNIDDLRARWRLRPVDATHTIVSFDLWLSPRIFAPNALINSEIADASGIAVRSVRTAMEKP
jgi:carbon monoxide dehydrogenase subunit G